MTITIQLCEYGCGREAKFPPRKGKKKWSCEYNYHACPAVNSKLTNNQIIQRIEKLGYEWIGGEYYNGFSNLTLICKNGHEYRTNLNNLFTGGSCPVCSSTVRWNTQSAKDYVSTFNYKLLSENYSPYEKLKFECSNGHTFEMRWDSFYGGHRCRTCYNSQQSIKLSGNGNPNWKGGISCEPYCALWNSKEFKEYIKERDGYKCLNPTCLRNSKILIVHHIDYNKKNCNKENLITVCNSCNVVSNYNREWHMSWFRAILTSRYGYTY